MTNICITIQGLIQKQRVDIDGENSAQISIAAKNIVTHDDLELWLWGPNKLYAILILQKTRVALFEFIYDIRLNLGMPKLVCPGLVYRCWK